MVILFLFAFVIKYLSAPQFLIVISLQLRTEYLSLLHGILSTTNYSEYKHQCNEIFKCLKRISEEESQEVEKDKLIVREILKTFTNIFPT